MKNYATSTLTNAVASLRSSDRARLCIYLAGTDRKLVGLTAFNFGEDPTAARQIVDYCESQDALLTLYRGLQQGYPAALHDLKAGSIETPLPPGVNDFSEVDAFYQEMEKQSSTTLPEMDQRTTRIASVNPNVDSSGPGAVLTQSQPRQQSGVARLLGCLISLLIVAGVGYYAYTMFGPLRLNQPVNRSDSLTAVSMVSAQDGWLVGSTYRQDEPTIALLLHWNGSDWLRVAKRINGDLNAVQMVSADEGWAVGSEQGGDSTRGLILHYKGGRWSKQNLAASGILYGLAMVSPDEGWAVGWGTILHYQQGVWQADTVVGNSLLSILHAVQMDSRKHGWAVGNGGTILEYDGKGWHELEAITNNELDALAFSGSMEGWAVGKSGTVLHYKDGHWRKADLPYTEKNLTAVCLLSASEGFALGSDGIMLSYSGGQWTKGVVAIGQKTKGMLTSPTADVTSATLIAASDGWATARYGNLLRFEGGVWRPFYRN